MDGVRKYWSDALAAAVDPEVGLNRPLTHSEPTVRAPSNAKPPTTSVYQAPRSRVASVVSESWVASSCHQARPRSRKAPTPGTCSITPVTIPAPSAMLPRSPSSTATPDPAATPSDRVLPEIVTLTAGRMPPVRSGSVAQRSARPWLAHTPPSSSDTAPPTPRYVIGERRCAAGESVSALKLEPPA